MADTKLSALGTVTPVLTDVVYLLDDPGGTPASAAATLQALMDLYEANFAAPAGFIDAITELDASIRSGADVTVVTGTAGTSGDLSVWNADGDLVDGPTPPTGVIVGTTDTQTLTNKTLTAPIISTISNSGTVTLPTGTVTLAKLGANTFTGTQNFNGQQVEGSLNKVVTSVTGALTTTAHSGNILKTSGNVTVPTTAGFNCVLIAGGAHTVTFNATTSAAMATGDLMTLVVESGTVIHAVLTASANKVGFT